MEAAGQVSPLRLLRGGVLMCPAAPQNGCRTAARAQRCPSASAHALQLKLPPFRPYPLHRLEGREQDMVQEKLKRSNKQPRAVPETAAAVAQAAAAHAPRMRPGAFVPREPAAAASPMAASPYGGPAHSGGSSGSEADGGAFGVQRQYSDGASAAAGAQQYQQYQRQAFTPPNALATPLPPRPASAYAPAAAAAVAPTPVPGVRPYTAPGGQGCLGSCHA